MFLSLRPYTILNSYRPMTDGQRYFEFNKTHVLYQYSTVLSIEICLFCPNVQFQYFQYIDFFSVLAWPTFLTAIR